MPPKRSTSYECPRCGSHFTRLSNYRQHCGRISPCEAKDCASAAIYPSAMNALVHVQRSDGSRSAWLQMDPVHAAASQGTAVQGNHNRVHVSNSHNTITNINLHFADAAAIQHFPNQSESYMTMDFKAHISRLAASGSGFNAALKELFKSAYFCPSRPYNVNVLLPRPGDIAYVLAPGGRSWVELEGDAAVREMIKAQMYHMESMREVARQSNKLDEASYDAFDRKWDLCGDLCGDEAIQAHVKELAMSFTDTVMGSMGHILQGVALCKQRAQAHRVCSPTM